MKDTEGDFKCQKCGGNTNPGRSGSITQWVVNCACTSVANSLPAAGESPTIEICSRCKKRVGGGRSGSLTQWIFRSDLCSCEGSISDLAGIEVIGAGHPTLYGADANEISTIVDGGTESQLKELPLDPRKFPVDRYAALEILGSGAAGTVYLCRDRLLKKKVAIKILTNMSDDQLVAFQSEAKSASQLNHPNVVKVMDFGITEGGVPFMVMELVKGKNLATIVAEEGTLNLSATIYIFSRICDGLSEAHKQGIFHRDIKSSNIIVGALDGRAPDVRLIDFGVASVSRNTDPDSAQSETLLVGTPTYMAPDQALGRRYDARCEIYSLGCSIFEALTGSTPFVGDTALELLNHHALTVAPTLSEMNSSVIFPDKLEKVVCRCLDKDPTKRYQTVVDLRNDLNSIATEDLGETESISDTSNKSNRRTAILAVVGLIAIFSLGGAFMLHSASPDKKVAFAKASISVKPKSGKSRLKTLPSSAGLPPGFTLGSEVDRRPELRNCWFANPRVTDHDLEALVGTHVRSLNLEGNKLVTNRGITTISVLPLTLLKLTDSNADDSSLKILAKMSTLQALYIDHTRVTNNGIKALYPLHKLVQLDLGGCALTDSGLESVITGFPNLMGLDIGDTNITPKGMTRVNQLKHLTGLRLSQLASDKEVGALLNMGLTDLDLTSCAGVTDASLSSLEKMKDLKFLDLTGCVLLTEPAVRKLERNRPDLKVTCNFLNPAMEDLFSHESNEAR